MPVSPSNDTNPELSSLEKASVAYERVSSEDRENPDADGLSRTLSTSRSSSTVALVRHTWVRDIGNALAHIVQILLETSVGVALTQAVFSLVGIFAPNALSVVPAGIVQSILDVPYPDMDHISISDSASVSWNQKEDADCDVCLAEFNFPSRGFTKVAQSVFYSGDVLPWKAPAGCGLSCNYTIVYNGPSLQCEDVHDFSQHVPTYGDNIFVMNTNASRSGPAPSLRNRYVFYNATSSLGRIVDEDDLDTGNPFDVIFVAPGPPESGTYGLSVLWSTVKFTDPRSLGNWDTSVLGGSSCVFMNATYSTSVAFSNGSQSNRVHVLEYAETYQFPQSIIHRQEFAIFGLIVAVTSSLVGSASVPQGAGGTFTPYFTHAFEGTGLFSYNEDNGTYRPLRLWLVYGIALVVALAADCFGLACMRSSGIAMQRTFSSIAASMRAPELSELLSGPEERPRAEARVAKLRYRTGMAVEGDKSGFEIVGGEARDKEQVVAEEAALNGEDHPEMG
ncbi:hypothetical protein PENSPDRAFT_664740 [Peniophora sp. CONT]|nr:hypothetical protein PENSPDRAFT_664740 [Peniophora sp. CONT]